MSSYKLIGLDQSEASIVRRHLHRWSKSDERAIRPILLTIHEIHPHSVKRVSEPRWETNVYPLYYWAERAVGSRKAYDHILEILPDLFPKFDVSLPDSDVSLHLKRIMNSEVDILVEDLDCFLFIEAKVPTPNRRARFQTVAGVHQLVRQYVQGKILEGLIRKPFTLATIGANSGEMIQIPLNASEHGLLQMINEEIQCLEISDLPWSLLFREDEDQPGG